MNRQPSPGKAELAGPAAYLEICRGRTTQPLRPILRERFLVGSDAACDLQLAAAGIPPLHSIIRLDGGQLVFEAIAHEPQPTINEVRTRAALLQDGDVIELGPFTLTLRISSAAARTRPSNSVWDDPSECRNVDELSAEELADLIESEQTLVEQFESREQLGARALLDAVRHRAQELEAQTDDNVDEQNLAALEAVVGELSRLADQTETRRRQMDQHEARQTEFALRLAELREALQSQSTRRPGEHTTEQGIRRAA